MASVSNPSPVAVAARHSASPRDRPPASEPRKFRPDIEGMRAFAILSVVLYHANIVGVRGGFVGVDVFFVISGFLITRQLLGSVGQHGLRALPTFYTRRIRRLLPAAATVVVATVVAVRLWAPPLSVRPTAVDGIFTTFYGLNYRLAIEGTQYLNEGTAASPLQHFWSLGVEEQFYFCWPILIVLVALVGRRRRNALLTAVLVAVVVISFWFSITVTRTDAPWAYFSLHTRAWELALGALVAVASSRLAQLPRAVTSVAGWLGLSAMVASAFLLSDSTPYPGTAAALPVVGAAVLIAAGCGPRPSVERVLGVPVLQNIGRISYSWYLWHWPLLIIAPMILDHALTWPERVLLVGLSLVAAIASYFVIENPARSLKMPNRRWFATGALLSAGVILAALVVIADPPSLQGKGAAVSLPKTNIASTVAVQQQDIATAELAGLNTTDAPSNLSPAPSLAHNDVPVSSSDGCHADYLVIKQGPCVFGDPAGKHTVVLFGDSHMQQWQPAFDSAGQDEHWQVVNWTKSACPPAEMTVYSAVLKRNYTECDTWRQLTLQRIGALKPDVIIMSGSEDLASKDVSPQAFVAATAATLQKLRQLSPTSKVIFLEDTPTPGGGSYSMPDCVSEHLGDVGSCVFATDHAYPYPARHAALAPGLAKLGITVVDPQKWICVNSKCPAVVGNLLVYRDATHLSIEFSQWLTPMVVPLLTARA